MCIILPAMTSVPLSELPEFARNVSATINLSRTNTKAVIIALRGELGAGKTTYVQQVAKNFGITESVTSPTYVLMKKYTLPAGLNPMGQPRRFKSLVHIDAYRLENPEEFKTLKPEEFLNDPACLVLVEWPEKLGSLLPKPDITLLFKNDGIETARSIDMQQ